MDRTLELPTQILHNILSRLSTKTAAQTSVLSKSWLKACSTNPHLSFDESYFQNFQGNFLRIVDNTLERYRHENLPISTFKLCISFSNQTDYDGLVDKWLDIVAEKGVSQVELLAKSRSRLVSERYTLSAYTIFTMESLQELELNHCKAKSFGLLGVKEEIQLVQMMSTTQCNIFGSQRILSTKSTLCKDAYAYAYVR
ncbi:F-box/LRR-repeat protein At3g58900-like [Nicotiana tomentosiformis]|uniref:F-box/LRR-repeat protein At3g58900-like n=1 Tax=Nicotiana tomentosiformis TaxID=4098 RepID=UPI00388C74CA